MQAFLSKKVSEVSKDTGDGCICIVSKIYFKSIFSNPVSLSSDSTHVLEDEGRVHVRLEAGGHLDDLAVLGPQRLPHGGQQVDVGGTAGWQFNRIKKRPNIGPKKITQEPN